MYKLCAALVVSFIAALVTLVAGIMTDARWETVFIRSAICFIFFGVVLSAVVFAVDKLNLLSRFGIDVTTDEEKAGDNADEEPPADTAAIAEEQGDTGGFVPLATDNLRHVSTQ